MQSISINFRLRETLPISCKIENLLKTKRKKPQKFSIQNQVIALHIVHWKTELHSKEKD